MEIKTVYEIEAPEMEALKNHLGNRVVYAQVADVMRFLEALKPIEKEIKEPESKKDNSGKDTEKKKKGK